MSWALKCCRKRGCVVAVRCCVLIQHVLCIIERLSPNMLRVMKREVFACDDFLFFLKKSCLPSWQRNIQSKAVCECEWLKKYAGRWRPEINYGLSSFICPLCLPGLSFFSLSLYNLYFIPHIMPSPPTGLPPPPAIAKRGLKTRGKQKLPSHHTYSILIHSLVLNLNM